jgi:hypothetical protein
MDAKPRVASRDDAEAALAADAAYREANAAYAGPDPAYPEPDLDAGAVPYRNTDAAYREPYSADTGGRYSSSSGDESFTASDPAADRAYRDLDSALGGETPASTVPDAGDRAEDDPDYDRASSFIGGARSENHASNAWRRTHADDGRLDLGEDSGSGLAEEFGVPDEDDPDDEPPPQAVRPADAVRVAGMTAEVEVVDGRPRYHMADCPHLVGRQTEALPVSEAVELGFSPCGQCRPVDRLVAQAARR